MRRPQTPTEHIRELDARLLVNAERLAKYRVTGSDNDVIVQRGVINRLLDERLGYMRDRDRN